VAAPVDSVDEGIRLANCHRRKIASGARPTRRQPYSREIQSIGTRGLLLSWNRSTRELGSKAKSILLERGPAALGKVGRKHSVRHFLLDIRFTFPDEGYLGADTTATFDIVGRSADAK